MLSVILDKNGDVYKIYNAGEKIKLSVKDWLNIAGITLDDINTLDVLINSDERKSFRDTGISVNIELDYDNTNNRETRKKVEKIYNSIIFYFIVGDNDYLCEIRVKTDQVTPHIPDKIQYLSHPMESDFIIQSNYKRIHRKAIMFHSSFRGSVTEFSFSELISALTDCVVLFNVAYIITKFIAFNILGDDSRLYSKYAQQETNLNKELAQFALQAAINAKIFRIIDVNNDRTISRGELKRLLQIAFGKEGEGAGIRTDDEDPFTEHEIQCLIDNILAYTADDGPIDRLTYAQFVDIVTECDEIDLETLRKRATYKRCLTCDNRKPITSSNDDEDPGLFIPPPKMGMGIGSRRRSRTKRLNLSKNTSSIIIFI